MIVLIRYLGKYCYAANILHASFIDQFLSLVDTKKYQRSQGHFVEDAVGSGKWIRCARDRAADNEVTGARSYCCRRCSDAFLITCVVCCWANSGRDDEKILV